MALTDSWLKANNGRPVDKEYVKSDRDGLSVRVSEKGRLSFQIRYRHLNKPKKIVIGNYPEMSLKAARDKAMLLRGDLKLGKDPGKSIIAEKLKHSGRVTIDLLWVQYYEAILLGRIQNPEQRQRTYEIHIKPVYGKALAEDIPVSEWVKVLQKIAKKKPSIADRLLTDLRRMYHHGIRFHEITLNPLADISAAFDLRIEKKEGSRVLSEDEIKIILEAVKYTRNHPALKTMFRLCLFFGCRVGELRLSERDHFKNDLWIVPAENHKTGRKIGRELVRPLLSEIRPEIERQANLSTHKSRVFVRPDGITELHDRAHLDMPYSLMNWIDRQYGIKMDHFSVHDLRRTARTFFSEITEPHIAEIMLGHSLPKIWRTYDKYYYLDEQRAAYREWYSRLSGLGF